MIESVQFLILAIFFFIFFYLGFKLLSFITKLSFDFLSNILYSNNEKDL